jgi:flagellar assembly factor FliW
MAQIKDDSERIIETRLGRLPVSAERIIQFPRGLIGFEDHREFTLLQIEPSSPFLVLQSLRDARLGLLVADPFSFIPDYEVRVEDAEQRLLKLENPGDLAVLVTVAIPQGMPDQTALNLTGPILVNAQARLGVQSPQTKPKFSGQFLLKDTGRPQDAADSRQGAAQAVSEALRALMPDAS